MVDLTFIGWGIAHHCGLAAALAEADVAVHRSKAILVLHAVP
jgi:hypothetical protein